MKKPTLLEGLVVLAIIALLVALPMPGIEQDRSHRYPAKAEPGGDLSRGFGEYYQRSGRGGGRALSILPDGRYSFVWSGCVGVSHREAGQARLVEGHILLIPEKANDRKIPSDLLPIRWGPREFLIPPQELPQFCDAIVAGREPRVGYHGSVFVVGDSTSDGLPEVPEAWQSYLKARVAIGKVAEFAGGGKVRVMLGSNQGVGVGDLLKLPYAWGPGDLRVSAVEPESCLAEKVDRGENRDGPKLGMNVVFARPRAPDR